MADYLVTDSELTSVANAIRTKGGTAAQLTFPADFVSAINDIPSGGGVAVEEKDVNFYDYDGTLVDSYTATEFAALSAMPSNPSHTGLTAQGWNWSLSDAKTYVNTYGKLDIGQMYITDDGKTRIYITLEAESLSPYVGLYINGTAVIDWGDGSSASTVTGSSTSTLINTQHIYATPGNYVISIDVTGEMILKGNGSYGSQIVWFNSTTGTRNRRYQAVVNKVEIGEDVGLGDYAFHSVYNLSSITIPYGITTFGKYCFGYCYHLQFVVFPSTISTTGTQCFYYCSSLLHISISNNISAINDSAFYWCISLRRVIIPGSVTSIGSSSFNGCYGVLFVVIPSTVTSIGSSAFSGCPSLKSVIGAIPSVSSSIFNGCKSLSTVTISSSATSIESSAFSACETLLSIIVPSSVTSIKSQSFNSCYSLAKIVFESSTPPTVESYSFGIPVDCKIYVPSGSLSAYTSATNYPNSSTYTYIEY